MEGSIRAYRYAAAEMLREKAKEMPGNPVAIKNLETIKKAMTWVLRRYKMTPKQRRIAYERGERAHASIAEQDAG